MEITHFLKSSITWYSLDCNIVAGRKGIEGINACFDTPQRTTEVLKRSLQLHVAQMQTEVGGFYLACVYNWL
jgi:hypothetical protein